MPSWLYTAAIWLHLWHPAPCASLAPLWSLPAVTAPEWRENTTPLCNGAYAVLASGITHGPLWSAEHLTRSTLAELPYLPRMGDFQPDYRLPAGDRANLQDYEHSGYD